MVVSCIECFFLERNNCVLNLKRTILYLVFCFLETELNYILYVCVHACAGCKFKLI